VPLVVAGVAVRSNEAVGDGLALDDVATGAGDAEVDVGTTVGEEAAPTVLLPLLHAAHSSTPSSEAAAAVREARISAR
jgi:hypothetical protein